MICGRSDRSRPRVSDHTGRSVHEEPRAKLLASTDPPQARLTTCSQRSSESSAPLRRCLVEISSFSIATGRVG